MKKRFSANVEMSTLSSREDWLEKRENRIGGSDAACILGLNPYKSNQDLWLEKTGRVIAEDISDKPYIIYGNKAEPLLRELFKLDFPQLEVFYEENNMFTNKKYPYAHASLDGWLRDENNRMGIWECKTTEIMNQQMKAKWNDRIPDNYYIQLLHYFNVTEFEFAVLTAQLKFDYGDELFKQTKHYFIERSEVEDDIKYLRQEEEKFFKYLKGDKRPPLLLPEI